MSEAKQEITADDLALVSDPGEGDGGDAGNEVVEGDKAAGEAKGKSIASGADAVEADAAKEKKAEAEHKPYWPDDWREKLAEHISAGDKKAYNKELTRLKRVTDPAGVYGMYRELDNRLNSGGLIKLPGKDAKDDEKKEFQKAIGWTEKPEEMLEKIALQDGTVLGDDDKPVLNEFLGTVHGATSAAEFVSKAAQWYFAKQEKAAADMDNADDDFHRQSISALKEEWGPSFNRRKSAIASVFATAPGGSDWKNEEGLFARLAGGRTSDGKKIGDDPDFLRWIDSIRNEINPAATVVEDGASTQSVSAELDKLRDMRKNDPQRYWSPAVQKRELELIEAQEKIQARQRA